MGNMDETSIEIILNNTVLSNFASVNRIHLLQDVLSGRCATMEQVKQEFQRSSCLAMSETEFFAKTRFLVQPLKLNNTQGG